VTGNRLHLLLRTLTLPALAAPLALAGPAGASASQQVINASLNSVSCPAANDCMAAGWFLGQIPGTSGFQNFPLAEHWNGSTWTVLPTPAPRHPGGGELLSSVSCASSTSCMAVGQTQVEVPPGVTIQHPFAESWNGTRWQAVPTPKMAHTGATLNGVSCTSGSDCMAVGNVGTPQNDTMFTLAERWNGTTWTVVGTPRTPGGTALNTVSCTGPSACMAAGFSNFNNGTGASLTLAEQWNGAAWQIRATPAPGRSAGFGGVACASAAACMGVGSWTDPTGESSFNLAEAWNGTSWSIIRTPDPGSSANELRGVACTSPSGCMAVGDFAGIGNELTLAEAWNGTSWSVVKTPHP